MARALIAVIVALLASAAAAAAPEKPPPLNPAEVEAGAAIYGQYCASCHGARAEGAPGWQEPNEQGELPPPPHGPEGHTWRHADAVLYHMVSKGWRDPFNETERLTMPAFGDVLSPNEIRAVITYLKSLWTPEQRRFQWQESQRRPFPAEAQGPSNLNPLIKENQNEN